MSEFTSGHLLLAQNKEAIRKSAVPGSFLVALDENWVMYLTPYDSYLERQQGPEFVYPLSKEAPVLYFCHFGDHFWGYRIFNEGQEVASLTISYEFAEETIISVFTERYPDKDILELYGDFHEEIYKEVMETGILDERVEHLFDKSNVAAFQLFNLSDGQIEELKLILNPTYYREQADIYQLVEEFKDIVGISEMSYIRHERVEEDGDYEERF